MRHFPPGGTRCGVDLTGIDSGRPDVSVDAEEFGDMRFVHSGHVGNPTAAE
jgi:hypothetical protein